MAAETQGHARDLARALLFTHLIGAAVGEARRADGGNLLISPRGGQGVFDHVPVMKNRVLSLSEASIINKH